MGNKTLLESQLCQISGAIFENPVLVPLLACTVAINTVAILLGIGVLYLLFRYPATFHWNTRILLANLSVSSVIMSLGSVIQNTHYIVRSSQNDPNCPYYESQYLCMFFLTLRLTGLVSVQFSLVSIAIERVCGTWMYKTYEGITHTREVAVGIIVQWCLAAGIILTMTVRGSPHVSSPLFKEPIILEHVPFCSNLLFVSDVKTQLPSFFANLISEILALAMYLIVLHVNKKKQGTTLINQALHSLTVRYQLSENIRATRMMLPSLMSHIAFMVPPLVAVIAIIVWHGGNPEFEPHTLSLSNVMLQSCLGWASLYGLGHPIICMLYTPKFNQVVCSMFTKTGQNAVVPLQAVQTPAVIELQGVHKDMWKYRFDPNQHPLQRHHFKMLSDQWK